MSEREIVICEGVRTPRGKGSPNGKLHGVTPVQLVGHVLDTLVARGLDPGHVGDVFLGCATQTGEQGGNIARTGALAAGWTSAGTTVNAFCASGLQAILLAASRCAAGDAGIIVAGGVESVSRVPMLADQPPLYTDPALVQKIGSIHMGVAADLVATLYKHTRDELDEYADVSRRKARMAYAANAFTRSLAPLAGLAHDELLDSAPDASTLAALPSLFGGMSADIAIAQARYPAADPWRAHHTKGNSPALADAAAVVIVADRQVAERAGLTPRARVISHYSAAVDPVLMLTAGQLATQRALARAILGPDQVDVFSFAEAFSALCLRFMKELDVGHERFNPNGGTMSLGHAFGATGAILVLDAIDTLHRRTSQYGVAAVSGAAGLGAAIVLERI